MRRLPVFIALLSGLVSLTLLAVPPLSGMTPAAQGALALVVLCSGLWATEALPVHLTSFIFFLLALVFSVAPPGTVFSGFHSGAVWLIFGGIVLGYAIHATGLGARFANLLIGRRDIGYTGIIGGIVFVSFGLAMVMPSAMGRILLLSPIVTGLAERLGYAPGSRGRSGMVLAMAFANVFPPMGFLPATVPNVVLSGAVESIYGISLRYLDYLVIHFPVAGFLSIPAVIGVALFFFREAPEGRMTVSPTGHVSRAEWRLLAVLLATLLFWMTDWLHGIAPAWVALGAAIVCMLPGIGFVPASALAEKVNYAPWFFVAGIVGLGAVVAESGLARNLGAAIIPLTGMAPGQDGYNLAAIIGIGGLLSLGVTYAGIPAILTPLANDLAVAAGWPLMTALMAEVASFFVILLPYQAAPIFTAMLLTQTPMRDGVRMCLGYSGLYLLLIAPANYAWWRFLGLFPS